MKALFFRKLKSSIKTLDLIATSLSRLSSFLIKYILDIDRIKRESVSLDWIGFNGSQESEKTIRDYVKFHTYPNYALKMLKRYPVTAVFCARQVRSHSINDVVFFDKEITSRKDVEKLLTRAVYRSFMQKSEKLGVQVTYGNKNRFLRIFHRRFGSNQEE